MSSDRKLALFMSAVCIGLAAVIAFVELYHR